MADISGASLGPIYERLNSAPSYHPLEADTFADWSLEAGDIVTVTRDNKGYQSPVHSSVVTWKKQPQVQISSTGNEQREAISKISQKKFSRGGSGLRANQALYWEMTSEDGLLHAVISATEKELRTEYTEAIAQTDTKLSTRITQNARSITLEAERASTAEGVLQGKITVEANRITQEVTERKDGEVTLQGKITVQADRITNEVTRAVDEERALRGALEVEADRVSMVVGTVDTRPIRYVYQTQYLPRPGDPSVIYYCQDSKKYYEWNPSTNSYHLTEPGKFIKAGEIVESINEAGETEAHIDADKVYIGNRKSTTVINGKLEASDITADFVSARIQLIATMTAQAINADSLTIRPVAGMGSVNVATAYNGSSLTLSGNTYKLRLAKMNGNYDEWTFSRATTLTGVWNSGNLVVTASPQNEKYDITLVAEGGDIKYYYGSDDEHKYDTGADYPSSSVSNIAIYGPESTPTVVQSHTMSFGEEAHMWAGVLKDGSYVYGDEVVLTAPTNPHPNRYTLYCTEAGQVPGSSTYRYRFSIEFSTPQSFSKNSSYYFYR
jgi:hypothetical protein